MKCQILFAGKNKKNITTLSSAELAKRVARLKQPLFLYTHSQRLKTFEMCHQERFLYGTDKQ